MEVISPEITLGESICAKIKQIYFADSSWSDCSQHVSSKFTLFRRIMKKIYPEKEICEILKSVQRFDTMDIQEVFDMEKDYLTTEPEKNSAGLPKYDKNVTWVPVPIEQ